MKPMSNLCWVCQQNSMAIMRAANTPEAEKTQEKTLPIILGMAYIHSDHQVLKDAEAHLNLATQERSYYRSVIDTSKEVLKETFTVAGQLQVPPISACLSPGTNNITMHFGFDMAQQVCQTLNI